MSEKALSRTRRRLLLLTVNDELGASTRYRVLAHLQALQSAGFHCEVRFPSQWALRGRLRRLWRAVDRTRDVLEPRRADLLFVHRKIYPVPLTKRLTQAASRRVFDMDDALDLPPPSRALDPAERRRYRRRFEETVNAFDLVLCGNTELAGRLPHDRFEVLPTPIDTEIFAPSCIHRDPEVLGWVGHSDNLGYLESLHEPLLELRRRHAALRLIVVADRPPSLPGIDVEFRRWSLDTELSCFDGMGIGLMPLDDSPWARGKCAFKAIQYMALGLPTVASRVGMNAEVIRHGDSGFLASGEREWVDELDRLLSDPDLAGRVGAAGRRRVEERYSLTVVSRRLVEILVQLDRSPPR